MRPASFLSFSSLLFGHFIATEAANPIFGAFVTPACEACLDAAFTSCPGDYKSRGYAECMCAGIGGEGGRKAISCSTQQCDVSINENTNVAIVLATYCVGILKELCPGFKEYLPQSVYDRDCSSSTTATGTAQTAAATTTSGQPSSSAPTTVESKSATPSQTKSASFATAAAVPAWGLFAGILGQAVQMAL